MVDEVVYAYVEGVLYPIVQSTRVPAMLIVVKLLCFLLFPLGCERVSTVKRRKEEERPRKIKGSVRKSSDSNKRDALKCNSYSQGNPSRLINCSI
jgi:hypothetical protein